MTDTAPNGWSQELLTGFRAGEREALTEVYRAHVREVVGLLRHGFSFESSGRARRFVGFGGAFEFQDALHETFRRAFEPRARDGYDGIRPYGPYLRTIARNVVLQRFRAREVLFPEMEPTAGEGRADQGFVLASPPPSPEAEAHRASVRALMDAFLSTLSATDRALVDARFVRGLSQREAAEELGLGRQRLRSREAKIRRRLLGYLRARGEGALVAGATSLALVSLPLTQLALAVGLLGDAELWVHGLGGGH
jgi:RNA polymerase sigma-70 factor (ECF subfamily)